ncbi:MAG TPA: CUAEP/CCAEP-tail radical SAM protein, partial [Candidatus Eisenbacteria bacterium]|nr:CUAEP/CCAEP-tail radical SAM protein [Candidatus Eisenbacteria bacterium]
MTPLTATSLRAPGAILLVSCYELGHQPLGIGSAAAFLRRAGFDPAALDLSVEGFDAERVRRARLICVSVPMHTALRLGVRAVAQVREVNPDAHVCFHGLYAALNAEWLLAHGGDSAIGGESEAALVSLAESLDADGALDAGTVGAAGVSTAGRPAAPALAKLDFPQPARDLMPPLERYARLEHQGAHGLVGYVEASRGCRHLCRHCPIPPVYHGRFFAVPAETVLADVGRLAGLGATHVTFGDPDFLNAPTHSLRVVRAMHAAWPGLTFDFTAKIEHVLEHRALFPALVQEGALFMVSAVESLSDTVLAHLDKGHTRADVLAALDITRDAGLALRPSLVAFTPWTTLEDYLDVLQVVEARDLVDHVDPVQFTIRLLIPPGSLLLDRPALKAHLRGFDPAGFGHRWEHPDPRMDKLHRGVTALVADATLAAEEARVTFGRIRALALAAAGKPCPASAGAE